jgi:hypothetical protein
MHVHATTAEDVAVEIELGDGTVSSGHTLDTVDFGYIESHASFEEKKSEQDRKQLKVQLEMISDEDMLARLKKYWDSDMTGSDQDIDADTFYNFILAADYLLLQGDKYKQFVKNVVRRGVLGKHSMAIVRQPLDEYYMGCLQRMAGQMLIALASRYGCEVRVMKRDDHKTEVTLCRVRDMKAESYGDICSVFETSPVIGKLSVRCNILSDKVHRMEILTWLTDHLEVPLLWIGSELRMKKEDTQSLVKWNGGTTHTKLGLSLGFSEYIQSTKYKHSSSSFVEALIPTIPALEELHIEGVTFEPSAAHTFGQCERLEKLCINGPNQDSSFVSALMPNLPNIRELKIDVGKLSTEDAKAFGQCKQLEKLNLDGYIYMQTSSFVSALMSNLPSIRELKIDVGKLGTDAAVAFGRCERLEKLYLDRSSQTSPFVSALMPNLPSIRELTIGVEELSPDAAAVFRQCERLEKLYLDGSRQTSPFVPALMPNLPNIRELTIGVEKLSPDAAVAFRECKRLEKLSFGGYKQTSPFVPALMPNLPNIRELTIGVEELSPDAAAVFRQCERLEKLYLCGNIKPGCVERILSPPHMDSLRYLEVGRVMGGPSSGDKKTISEALKRHVVVNVR